MAIRIREVNGRNYVYFCHYPNGKKVDVYCGAESKPESRRKALKLEIKEIKRQIGKLEKKLSDLKAGYERIKND